MLSTGHQLRVARTAAWLSQEELAAGSGVSRQTILRYEQLGALPPGVHRDTLSSYLIGLGGLRFSPTGTMVVEVQGV